MGHWELRLRIKRGGVGQRMQFGSGWSLAADGVGQRMQFGNGCSYDFFLLLTMPNAQCPMPNAQCPIPHAPCPIPMPNPLTTN
jgi:hypothetical protein